MIRMDFFDKLEFVAKRKGTSLCVGLDPRIAADESDPVAAIVSANRRIVEATAPYVAAYKPNVAFYEAWGAKGLAALEETLALIPDDIPVILDAKRCDIGATAEAYAQALMGRLGADAVTLSPYMGRDAVDPFFKYAERGVFLLCRTSNPGAGAFQDLVIKRSPTAGAKPSGPDSAAMGDEPLYLRVAAECSSWSPSVGLVVAGNDIAALRACREAAPRAWFLAPGIGAQGGKADEALAAGARPDGFGVLVVAARSVAEAGDPGAAARELRDAMEAARSRIASMPKASVPGFVPGSPAQGLKEKLLAALIRTGCFKLGDFLLKSGKRSPFYIDLRRLISDPEAMELAAEAYAFVSEGLRYDRIAGIPAAGLPLATAASMRLRSPMVWPRMPVKDHGTGNKVEGAFEKGERLLLLDDLITTGASKLEAAQILRGEGLVVQDLVVLIERGKQGRKDMEAEGIALHAFVHVRDIFSACEAMGLVDAARRRELERFVDEE
jgi:uridine monophosphate synthetase